MKKRDRTELPEFQSLEEEKRYWEARGPLAEGQKGRVNKPQAGQRRSSFLVVRLTGEEMTKLRDIAARQGFGPSTFARRELAAVIEQGSKAPVLVTLEELGDTLERKLPQPVRENAEVLLKAVAFHGAQNSTRFQRHETAKGEDMLSSVSHAINAAIGGNPGWSYSRQAGVGLARALGLRVSRREASDLTHLAASLSVLALRGSGMTWKGALGWTAGLSLLFWALGKQEG